MCDHYVTIKTNKENNYIEIFVAGDAIFRGEDTTIDLDRILSQYVSMGYELKIEET